MEIDRSCQPSAGRIGEIVYPAAISRSEAEFISTLSPLYFLVHSSYKNLELHLHPQQEIRSGLRIEEVFCHQLSAISSR